MAVYDQDIFDLRQRRTVFLIRADDDVVFFSVFFEFTVTETVDPVTDIEPTSEVVKP